MIVIAFALFALLVLGWLAAPNGPVKKAAPKESPAAQPTMTMSESAA
jgi:hypothetical protein